MASLGTTAITTKEHASPRKGRNKVSGSVSVPCWHAIPVEKGSMETSRELVVIEVINWCKV